MHEIYKKVAEEFAKRINEVFTSEESMKVEFSKIFEHLDFDRTNHGSTLIFRLLRDCWLSYGPEVKSEPTGFDKLAVLRELVHLLDYNLFTQVLLNLQSYTGMAYMTEEADKDIEKLKEEWPKEAKLNPFEPKAKMVKQASTEEEKKHNLILSTMKSLKIISQFTPQVSWRVSALQQTPAFADSKNLSMLGIGADRFLKTIPNLAPFYIYWDPGSSPLMAESQSDGGFTAKGIPYPFYSKSGGDILQSVLFSRLIMSNIFMAHDVTSEMCILIPRMNSVLVVCDKNGHHLKKAFELLHSKYPMLELAEGTRI